MGLSVRATGVGVLIACAMGSLRS